MTIDNNNTADKTESFLDLLMKNQKHLYAYILTMVSNLADADDIMQATTTVMWRKFSEYEKGTSFVAWGIKISQYEILMHRRNKHKEVLLFNPAIEKEIQRCAADLADENNIRLETLKLCLAKLSNKHREILKLYYEDNQSQKTIAQNIEMSAQSVCKNMSKAHDFLLRCVRRTMAIEEDI